MKLMTKELEDRFKKYPLYSQDGLGGDSKVIAKFFNPVGSGTWLAIEGSKQENGDYMFFGYCMLGDPEMAEMGYFSLNEIENIKLPFGLGIERDLYFGEKYLDEALKSSGLPVPDYLNKNINIKQITESKKIPLEIRYYDNPNIENFNDNPNRTYKLVYCDKLVCYYKSEDNKNAYLDMNEAFINDGDFNNGIFNVCDLAPNCIYVDDGKILESIKDRYNSNSRVRNNCYIDGDFKRQIYKNKDLER